MCTVRLLAGPTCTHPAETKQSSKPLWCTLALIVSSRGAGPTKPGPGCSQPEKPLLQPVCHTNLHHLHSKAVTPKLDTAECSNLYRKGLTAAASLQQQLAQASTLQTREGAVIELYKNGCKQSVHQAARHCRLSILIMWSCASHITGCLTMLG